MAKRFVLSGYFGFKNFGDEAILSILVNKLQQDRHRLTIISSDPQYTKSKFKHVRSVYTFDFSDIIGFISKSDFLISGGGSLLQDSTSLKSLIYYLSIIFIALVFRKKVIIFSQGIGPINTGIGKFLARNILRHCDYISVRDIKSQKLLESWNISSELVCDPVFLTEIPNTQKDGSVAIQLRNFKTMTEDFIDRLALKVAKKFNGRTINIYPFQSTIDDEICHRFEKALKLLETDSEINVCADLTDSEIISGISKAEYLIAMRFHAIIIGIMSCTKTLGINYDVKVEKLCSEFELPYIELNKDFKGEFERLKALDCERIKEKASTKVFNWENLDKILSN